MAEKSMRYGVVIDSGSSGSRLQIYQWEDLHELQHHSKDQSVLNSVPKLIQQEKWSFKITPGISSFEDKPEKIWDEHFKHIVEFLEEIIPMDQHNDTPFFVLATAGMRLLPEDKRFKILNNICSAVNTNSLFQIPDCQNYVQVIDGETEGLFGWVALNYLMGQFESENKNRESYGFMDMGGASTQIAFVPSDLKEIEKHKDDLYTVTLRTVNGQNQNWDVFVSTWLGFGANQARKRHFKNALLSLPDTLVTKEEIELNLVDPCSPKGAVIEFNYKGEEYKIQGLGNYEYCLKEIYPLLLKHLPCKDEPCLFNGVHAPQIDFEKDKFVGVSEYWYTANDIFDMGGEYSFLKFNEKVKEFCTADWDSIVKNFNEGKYGGNMKLDYLKDSCFKASWVINVLHEGFGLPRIGLETDYLNEEQIKSVTEEKTHIPFQSANLIKGAELSWTLGKMLLYISSTVESEDHDVKVGIKPSDNGLLLQEKKFVAGNIYEGTLTIASKDGNFYPTISSNGGGSSSTFGTLSILIFVAFILFSAFHYLHLEKFVNTKTLNLVMNSPVVQKIKLHLKSFYYSRLVSQETIDIRETNLALSGLEEGLRDDDPIFLKNQGDGNLRTRSSIVNLSNMHSSNNASRPQLPVSGSTSSIGSLLDFQNSFRSLSYKKSSDNLVGASRNSSVLDFNKLRSSITNAALGSDARRVSSTKLQTD